jgi:hypothetical protein
MDELLKWADWVRENWFLVAAVLVVLFVLIVLRKLLGGVARLVRRKKAVELHPKLQKYAGINEADAAAEREAAGGIIATSSTGAIPGYEIVRQVEVLFVEGRRTPSEAITALKAAAVQSGANAVINLSQEHSTAGRCTARGDAVVVRPTDTSRRPAAPPQVASAQPAPPPAASGGAAPGAAPDVQNRKHGRP